MQKKTVKRPATTAAATGTPAHPQDVGLNRFQIAVEGRKDMGFFHVSRP